MKTYVIGAVSLFLGGWFAGCSGINQSSGEGCGFGSQQLSVCDVSNKTYQLESRVNKRERQLDDVLDQIARQQQMLEELNSSVAVQNKVAQKLMKIAYTQHKITEDLKRRQAHEIDFDAEKTKKAEAKSQTKEQVPEKTVTETEHQSEKPEIKPIDERMQISRAKSAPSKDVPEDLGDYKEERFTPSTFKLQVATKVYADAGGHVAVEEWAAGELFTAFIKKGPMIKVSGIFTGKKSHWTAIGRALWIPSSAVSELKR